MDAFKRPKKPNRLSSLFKSKKPQLKRTTVSEIDQNTAHPAINASGDRQRTVKRYVEATTLFEDVVKKQKGRWKVFNFPELSGEPEGLNDTVFKDRLNLAMEAKRDAISDQTTWEKCKHTLQCCFAALSPFAKNFLMIAKDGSAMNVLNPYGLLCGGLLLLITIAENESSRKKELAQSLDYICQQMEQLSVVSALPEDFEEREITVNRAMDVRSASMLYLAIHIRHDVIPLGTVGKVFNTFFTGDSERSNSTTCLKNSVEEFSKALRNFHARVGMKTYELVKGIAALNVNHDSHGRGMDEDKFVVPYERNRLFTGRKALLRALREKLLDKSPKKYNHRIALHGMGGVGKTQCVLEYVYANRTSYDRVYWITAVDPSALLSGFQTIARKALLPVAKQSTNLNEIAEAVLLWLRQQQSWLIVIDNLDDITVASHFLPENNSEKHTLITTRDPNTSGIPAESFEISLLDPEDAIELLSTLSKIPIPGGSTEVKEAKMIVDELGCLPLAIEQAAAFIREVTGELSIFRQEYCANRKEVHQWVPKGNRQYIYCVATWSMSFEILRSRHPNAVKLLQLFAFLNPDGILIDFLIAGAKGIKKELRQVISSRSKLAKNLLELERFSLVKWNRAAGLITIHRLVQTVVSDEMTEADRLASENTFIDLCLQAFPTDVTSETRSICRQYQSQVLGPLMRTQTTKTRKSAEIKERVGYFLYLDGKYHDGHIIAKQVVETSSSVFGIESQATLRSLSLLALFQSALGKRDEALQLREEVLEKWKKVSGVEHPDTLDAMHNLAISYATQGRRDEALQLQEEVLEKRKKVSGVEHPDTLAAMHRLAISYDTQGRRDEALQLQEEVLEKRKKVLGVEHPDTLDAMHNLAISYASQGRRDEALQLQEEVLEKRKKVSGVEHPATLDAMHNLAISYATQRRRDEALHLREEVLEKRKKVLGVEHPDTLHAMYSLATLYDTQGRRDKALQLREEVLKKRKKVLRVEHPDILAAMHYLAVSYDARGRRDEAL